MEVLQEFERVKRLLVERSSEGKAYLEFLKEILDGVDSEEHWTLFRDKLANEIARLNKLKEYKELKRLRNAYVHEGKGEYVEPMKRLIKELEGKLEGDLKAFEEKPKLYFLYTFSPKMMPRENSLLSLYKQSLDKVSQDWVKKIVESPYFHWPQDERDYYRGHPTSDAALYELLKEGEFEPLAPLAKVLKHTFDILGYEGEENLMDWANKREDELQSKRPTLRLKKFDMVLVVPLGAKRLDTRLHLSQQAKRFFETTDHVFFGIIS
ncbi:MAG: hypothetical protein GXN92_02770 [Candidatus Micrarchaeota archaeon]|nr:hypothetical protein [Candidatus Micrarchaeota archaeon]